MQTPSKTQNIYAKQSEFTPLEYRVTLDRCQRFCDE